MTRVFRNAFVLAMALASCTNSWAITLRNHVLLEHGMIRLGDVFADPGHLQDEIIEPAPAPGQKVQLRAPWAVALAKRYHLDWQPTTLNETITIERAGRTLELSQIESTLRAALQEQTSANIPESSELVLDREAVRVIVPVTEKDWSLRVDDLRVTDRRFQAHLVVCESGHLREHRVSVSGQWVDHMSLPVLKKPINPGEVIGPEDLVVVQMRGNRVRTDVIADPRQLVGKTPSHRALTAGEPLRITELKLPHVIQRNAIVTLVVETPLLLVTARGRALNDAAAGEEAHVANLDTKKVVSGIAVRPGVVSLMPSGSY